LEQDEKKRMVGRAALEHVEPGTVVGVGTGTTANHFIDALADMRDRIEGAVASSRSTAERLECHGIRVVELAAAGALPLYVDGADEATRERYLIKGGGGALTREKVVAAASKRFVCVIDDSKLVEQLGAFPLPVEVIPMAVPHVAAQLTLLGGRPRLRDGFRTDNGNLILDVLELPLADPVELESELNQIAGVVTHGLFCRRPADLLLIGTEAGVRTV